MRENDITKLIMLGLSKLGAVIFRSNTGQGWVGTITAHNARSITLADPRPLHAGLTKGSSDLIGWQSVTITPEMVGKQVAIFTAIEVKNAKGRLTDDQRNFLNQVQQAGGCAFVARSGEEAVDQMRMFRDITGIHSD